MATITVSKSEHDALIRAVRALTTSGVVSNEQVNNLRMTLRALDDASAGATDAPEDAPALTGYRRPGFPE